MRHDMGNHIQMIERLMGADNSSEAFAYLGRLKSEWQELTPEIRTGNPVTDMILLEKATKHRCVESGLNVTSVIRKYKAGCFDVCIILYNALNNCMESVNGENLISKSMRSVKQYFYVDHQQ